MAKTEIEIERDFYSLVEHSPLKSAIHGKVYRRGQRPDNANTEDCIVKYLGGIDEQVQRGTVVLNIYIPYITYKDGRRGEDLSRIGEIQSAVNDFISGIDSTDYYITKETTPQSYQLEDIEQTVIAVRLKFQRLNQD